MLSTPYDSLKMYKPLMESEAWQSAYRALFGEQEGEKDGMDETSIDPCGASDSVLYSGEQSDPVPAPAAQEVARPEPAGNSALEDGLYNAATCSLRLNGSPCGQCDAFVKMYEDRKWPLPVPEEKKESR